MVVLGREVGDTKEVVLTSEARRQGVYVVGITGTGKTILLLNMALSDIKAGEGLCLLDPHGDLVEDLLRRIPEKRVEDVILFDPADSDYPFGLNLFEWPDRGDSKQMDRICAEVIGTFRKLFSYSWGPRMEDVLRHTTLTLLMNEGSTMLDMPAVMTDKGVRARFLSSVSDLIVQRYWEKLFPSRRREQEEWTASSLNKIGRFLANPLIRNIVSQPRSTINFREIMDQGKILLVNLSKGQIGEDNSSLLGSVLVGKILVAALSRAEIPREERRRFHLIVDEYQSFATASFPTLQSEARKFNIDTVVAHQYRDQLDRDNRGSTLNVGNLILFRVNGPDSRELASQFDNTPPKPDLEREPILYPTSREGVYRVGDKGRFVLEPGKARPYSDVEAEMANRLTNLWNFQAWCKLVEGRGLAEYYIETNPPPEGENPEIAKRIKEASRAMATPRERVERMIEERFEFYEGKSKAQTQYYD